MAVSQAQINAQNQALIAQMRSGTPQERQAQSQADSASLGSNMQTFLTLLTKQLQNQDPLSPMDTADFTNQLVLYTQAEQQIKTNKMLEGLIAINKGTIGTQAIGYIGKEVSFAASDLYVENAGDPQTFYFSLEDAASKLTLTIQDEDGNTVRSMTQEELKDMTGKGSHKFTWDGKNDDGVAVEPGDYKVVIGALDAQNKSIKTSTLVSSRVIGLESDGSGSVNLILSGDRSIGIGSILSVQERPSVPATS